MQRTVVINVVGLSRNLIGEHMPHLLKFLENEWNSIRPQLPAVTTASQTTYLTGTLPGEHGIVGNGWYFRDEAEIKFWRQSDGLVQKPRIWTYGKQRSPEFTCASMFWWYNMYPDVEWSMTPRPMYPADGRKLPDVYSHPPELRFEFQKHFGQFPLFNFWGPKSSIQSSQWIMHSAFEIERRFQPSLNLVYLPHLDYGLQKYGPDLTQMADDLKAIDSVIGEMIEFFSSRNMAIIILSEYGIDHVENSISLNRIFRQHGLIAIREELGRELLDAGACRAFAVADHQIAHIYVRRPEDRLKVRSILEETPGIEMVLGEEEKMAAGLSHERAGDFIAIADRSSWFNYYYWLEDSRAPDFARAVDIHRKPGYDPVELFIDPEIMLPYVKAAKILLKKKLGFRYIMDLIGFDTSLVKGSHGRAAENSERGALLISNRPDIARKYITAADQPALSGHSPGLFPQNPVSYMQSIAATDVRELILEHIFAGKT